MAGLFNGLEIGKRALATHQLWMNTVGHNIANVNTPGYTRQRVETRSTMPFQHAKGPIGTGVTAIGVRNVRDLFLNQQYRKESQDLGKWSASEKTIQRIEQIFYEPTDGSISTLLNQFWDNWSDVATHPQEQTYRTTLITNTNMLTNAMHRMHDDLTSLQKSVDNDIRLSIEKINTLASEIADLNGQIARTEISTDQANDLRDQRDFIIDQLSELANINTSEESTGSVTIYVGSLAIVERNDVFKLGTQTNKVGEQTLSEIVWKGTNREFNIAGGELDGLLETRDRLIPKYMAALDEMAQTLVTNVNAMHRTGYGLDGSTDLDFFDEFNVSAGNIRLSDDIGFSPNRIAAASESDAEGNNINALAISELRNSILMEGNSMTVNDFYTSLIGIVASESEKVQHLKSNFELMVAQVDNARQSVQGVSLDEEMAQMIKYQHAYEAAARVITTMDQALDLVINRMGLVGR